MGVCLRLLAAVILLLAPAFGFAATSSRTPNLVLITVDTLRADRVGCYGYRQAHTPNMDKLASEGVRFQHAYTPVPITLPAHAVMMTGTYPMLNGMHDFSG